MSEVLRLRQRVEQLEELLGLDETIQPHFLKSIHTHRGRVEVVLKLLVARQMISEYAIGLAIGRDELSRTTASVYIHFARKALAAHGLDIIKNDWSRGWYVASEDKPKLRALMRGEATRPVQTFESVHDGHLPDGPSS